jgi:hypothetical protein
MESVLHAAFHGGYFLWLSQLPEDDKAIPMEVVDDVALLAHGWEMWF